jgi:hypothetical protein
VNLSGAQGGNPFSSPSRPGSVNQNKFIHLLKSEWGQVPKKGIDFVVEETL